MIRTLKADFYRLFHGIAFYLFPGFLMLILLIPLFASDPSDKTVSIADIFNSTIMMLQYLSLPFACIVLTHIWSKETKNGYIKNLAGGFGNRTIPVISKLITGVFVVLIYSGVAFLFSLLADIFEGDTLVSAPLGDSLNDYLLMVFAGIAGMSLFLLIHELFGSPAAGIIIAIALWSGLVENLLANLIYLIFRSADIVRYFLLLGLEMEETGICEHLIRTTLFLLIFTAGAVFTAHRKDIA